MEVSLATSSPGPRVRPLILGRERWSRPSDLAEQRATTPAQAGRRFDRVVGWVGDFAADLAG